VNPSTTTSTEEDPDDASRPDAPPLRPGDRVLFLCSHNSARSIMAESILRALAGDRIEVHSAGLDPGTVHPLTLRVLGEDGLPVDGLASTSVADELGRSRFDHAIVVCDRAAEAWCPSIHPNAMHVHRWPFPDPAAATGSDDERLTAFRSVRDTIRRRLEAWVGTP